jgi:hypothetical protein
MARTGRKAEQDRKDDQTRFGLAHRDEAKHEDARDEALRRQDREGAVGVGEPVGDDAAKDGGAVQDSERILRDVWRDSVRAAVILDAVSLAVSAS